MKLRLAYSLVFLISLPILAENKLSETIQGKPMLIDVAVTSPHFSSQSIIYENLDPGFSKTLMDRYVSYGYTNQTVWMKIELYNDTNHSDFILNLGNSHMDRVELIQKSQERKESILSGDLLAYKDWPIKEYRIAFPIHILPMKKDVFFLRVDTSSTINFYTTMHTPENFFQSFANMKMLLGFFYGAISIMVLYNFIIYIMLWDRSYLYYSLAILSNLFLQIYLNGMDYPFILGDFPHIRNSFSILIVGTSSIFGIQFARHFLQTKTTMPIVDTYFRQLIRIIIILSPLVFYLSEVKYLVYISNIMAQVFAISILFVILRGLYLKNLDAKLYLLAWSVLLVGIITWSLLEIGVVPYNYFTVYSNQIGSIIEASILSLALAERINTLKQEKQDLQAKVLIDLEEKVQERTAALNQTLQTIRKDIFMAKKIQEDSIPSPHLHFPHLNFSRLYEPMSIVGGDYMDIFQRDRKKYRVFLADATGHGVQAALITMAIRSEYEGLKHKISSPHDILHELNQIFIKEYYSLHIIFSCVVADILISHDEIQFASAGHPDQLLANGTTIQRLPRTGRIIGLSKDSKYTKLKIPFNIKDRLYLFSDGIVEQPNPNEEAYGDERLMESLKFMHEYPLKDIPTKIHESLNLHKFSRIQEDDLTLLGIERIIDKND
jgi:serine phosphatase RsbU (regulator of sigma subunit)